MSSGAAGIEPSPRAPGSARGAPIRGQDFADVGFAVTDNLKKRQAVEDKQWLKPNNSEFEKRADAEDEDFNNVLKKMRTRRNKKERRSRAEYLCTA